MKQQMRILKQSSQLALILMAVMTGIGLNLFQPTTAKADTPVSGCSQALLNAAIDIEYAALTSPKRVYYQSNCNVTFGSGSRLIDNSMIIDGNGFTVVFDGNNANRLFFMNPASAIAYTLELRGVTLQKGLGAGGGAIVIQNVAGSVPTLVLTNTKFLSNTSNGAGNRGGAILNNFNPNLNLLIQNSSFISNGLLTGNLDGGAVYIATASSAIIQNSSFINNSAIQSGGALYLSGGNLTISNTTFTNNTVTASSGNGGGALYNNSIGTINIYDSTFTNNTQQTSGQHGGAMYLSAGTTNIYTGTFTNNRTTVGTTSNGGAIFVNNASTALNIYTTTMTNNRATNFGGAIHTNSASPLFIQSSSFISNSARQNGGAIYASGGTNITNSTFITNATTATTGSGGGGAFYTNSPNPVNINNSTFSNNSALPTTNGDAGAVYINAGTTNIYNSTFFNNRAFRGGAIKFLGGTAVNVYHSTIVNNTGGVGGRGGGIQTTSPTAVTLYNTLIANNTAPSNPNCAGSLNVLTSNSFTNDNAGCSPQLTNKTNLNFGTLGNNGGTTQTVPLFAGSDAIDTARAAECTAAPISSRDQRGFTRTTPCDVGAFEFVRPTLSISDSIGTEGSSAVVTVTLSFPISQSATVTYSTAATGSAILADFSSTTGMVTFLAGETSKFINIPLTSNDGDESTENFYVNLSSAISATIARSQAVVTIIDNDTSPSIFISQNASSVTEPISPTDTLPVIFKIELSVASGLATTVDYNIAGTAIPSADYDAVSTPPSGTITFLPGELSKTLVITAIGDLVADGNRTLTVNLSNANGANISIDNATTIIVDSDSTGNIQVYFANDSAMNEGNAGQQFMQFTVQSNIQPGIGNNITVTYTTADVTASAFGDNDYTSSAGTVYITNASWPNTTFSIPINGDLKDEANETFFVNISTSTSGVTVSDSQAIGTITNDDVAPIANITNVTATEGNSGTNSMVFAVSLAQASSKLIAINYTTVNSTAIAGVDYTAKSGTLNFTAGNIGPQYILVDVLGDTLDEVNENFQVQLLNTSTNVTILTTTNTATGTIIDDDTATVSINDVTQDEGNIGTTNFVFNVSLSTASDRPITITYQTSAGTATSDVDYRSVPSATLTFSPTVTQSQITIVITSDLTLEPDETFFVKVLSATNATVPANTQGKGTILDDDPFAAIGISDVTVTEGINSQALFTITLTPAVLVDTIVSYNTLDNTAKAGLDYQFLSGTVTIPAGSSQKTVAVPIINDILKENTETFFVNLTNSTGPQIGDAQGIGTILDNDGSATTPTLTIANSTLTEGDSGTKTMLFTVTLSITPGQTVSVDYTTADGTAKAGSDYVSKANVLTFPADGATVQTFTVSIMGDILDEFDEAFSVQLSNPQNAVLGQDIAIGTIKDNDTTAVTIGSSANLMEGDSGTTLVNLTLALSLLSDHDVSIRYNTINGTAVGGSDFISQTGVVTFSAGITQQSISMAVMGDTLDELDETFSVQLSQPNQATSIITIKDDDNTALTINDVAQPEGNSGITQAQFTVSLSLMSDRVITVAYSTASDTATPSRPGIAILNPDYMEAAGVVTFSPTITSQVINISILGDEQFEGDEIYYVNLTNSATPIINNQGKGTILNDDINHGELPAVSIITNTRLLEGDSGTTNVVLTVTLTIPSDAEITVTYTLKDGTANLNSDYQGISGTLTFAPGATRQFINVPIMGDLMSEADETFEVTLTPNSQVEMGAGQSEVTILNDDIVKISIEPTTTTQEGQAPNEAIFTVNLSRLSDRLVAVEYKTVNDTAVAGLDFVGQNAFLSFNPGETVQTIHIPIIDDSDIEPVETFKVLLSNPNRAIIQAAESTATIRDNDGSPTLYMNALQITEGNSGTKEAIFNFTIWPTATTAAQVDYATMNGTAQAGKDYQAMSGTLTILPNNTSTQISIPIIGDVLDEFDETFTLTLTNPVNIILASHAVTGTIEDDDTAQVSMGNIFALNGPNAPRMATFTVILSLISDHDIIITFRTHNGTIVNVQIFPTQTTGPETALSGQDFVGQTGVITIPAGELSQTITIPILDNNNNVVDPAKVFTVILTSPTMDETSATATILDDDGEPKLYINNAKMLEGNSGKSMAAFTAQLWPPATGVVIANYATADGTVAGQEAKVSDSDYETASGQLTFVPNGPSSQTISVPIMGDLKVEVDELFMVNLSNAIGAELGISQGVGTILNDDLNPLTISDAQIIEGNSGSQNMAFTVTLATASNSPVTVDYTTVANTAKANEDFEPTSGTLVIPSGSTSASIIVKINGDTAVEADETFFIQLSNPVNTSLTRQQAIGTIRNDDAKPLKMVYIPLILKQPETTQNTPTPIAGPPDLIVQNIVATNNRVEVTIKNNGGTTIPTSQAFWVELYVNPNPVPLAVNQSWRGRSSEGVVWRVANPALPLAPNGTMTLVYSTQTGAVNSYYVADFSHFIGNLAAGTALYAQVDSSNASTTYGVVLENHELNGGSYNNILGPVLAK